MSFFEGRSLKFNLSPVVTELKSTARAAIDSIPSDVRKRITEFLTEGRGKKKKLLKTLLPILIGAKVKIAALIALGYLTIALIAKKAILASLISIAISAFIGIKKLLSQQQQHHPHHEVHEAIPIHSGWSGGHGVIGGGYSAGGGSFDSSGYGGHGEYGSHSSPVGHAIAYSAHKPVRR
ncbi:uncharacterized protein [Anabrus simplex]|uniref:uncharacterized protein n=1 Tax=Anabrus simplex TaxID=316456 RepID=UPI0035A3A584